MAGCQWDLYLSMGSVDYRVTMADIQVPITQITNYKFRDALNLLRTFNSFKCTGFALPASVPMGDMHIHSNEGYQRISRRTTLLKISNHTSQGHIVIKARVSSIAARPIIARLKIHLIYHTMISSIEIL